MGWVKLDVAPLALLEFAGTEHLARNVL